jgi:hypothetical protein
VIIAEGNLTLVFRGSTGIVVAAVPTASRTVTVIVDVSVSPLTETV